MDLTKAEKLQAVINTLATLEMPATFDNVNRMTGIYRTLMEVRDAVHRTETEEAEEDGREADAE